MICSFGDKQDVDWIIKNKLPLIESIDESGKICIGPYTGLAVKEAREKIISDLNKKNLLIKQETIKQSVGTCWRCHKPIEILHKEQWFINVTKYKDYIIKEAEKINWIPDYMKYRLIDWTKNMGWDWCISRKKIFGTPIPVWYCLKCKKVYLPEKLPVNPAIKKLDKKCECGGEIVGEKETFDTWMDSSFTIAYICKDKNLYPVELQPNGSDIIRTWDYYLLVRHLFAFDEIPYKNCLINGMVLGSDGKKMSKSLGNFVTLSELMEKYPADAIRYWTYLTTPGTNIIFSEEQIKRGIYLLTKLWNASRFCSKFLEKSDKCEFTVIDGWILSKFSKTADKVIEYLENYEIFKALSELEQFFVNEFCDYYLEFVKYRLYNEINSHAAKVTLHLILKNLCKLFAPFFPYISESIYLKLFKEKESVHLEKFEMVNYEFNEEYGELLKKIISEIRKWKISNRISLGKEIDYVKVKFNIEKLKVIEKDIKEIGKIKNLEFEDSQELIIEF